MFLNIIFVDLQGTTIALDTRVTALEENAGDGRNTLVAELIVRVETLEGKAADHETRISATEVDVSGRSGVYIFLFISNCLETIREESVIL